MRQSQGGCVREGFPVLKQIITNNSSESSSAFAGQAFSCSSFSLGLRGRKPEEEETEVQRLKLGWEYCKLVPRVSAQSKSWLYGTHRGLEKCLENVRNLSVTRYEALERWPRREKLH